MLENAFGIDLIQERAIHHGVTKQQAPIARKIDIDDLNIRIDETDIVFAGQLPADAAVALLVVDGSNPYADSLSRIIV
jgi:hypothetical protein